MKDGKIIYIDGKVLVNDYTKNSKNPIELKEYEYQDNIIELMEQENIVEELENEKIKLNDRIQSNHVAIKSYERAKKILTAIWIGMPLFAAFLGFLMSFNSSATPLFGIKQHWLSMGITGTIITSLVVSFPFSLFKSFFNDAKKYNNGYKLQLEELEKELEKNKDKLNKLKNNKSKKNEQQAMSKKTDDIHNIHLEKYKKIRRNLLIYRKIGENEKKFFEYYNNNILEEKLNDEYDHEEIEKIKTYFKNKK